MPLHVQAFWLIMLAIPVATVSWTVTHEEIFRELREYCRDRSECSNSVFTQKLFYILTCEYCLSHWVALFFALLTGYHLLLDDWRGMLIALLALVWVANFYMSAFGRLRLGIKAERKEIEMREGVLARRG